MSPWEKRLAADREEIRIATAESDERESIDLTSEIAMPAGRCPHKFFDNATAMLVQSLEVEDGPVRISFLDMCNARRFMNGAELAVKRAKAGIKLSRSGANVTVSRAE